MNTVTVNASGSYDIFIGRGILPMLGEKIQALGAVQKITLVSDSTVCPLYGEAVTAILEKAGFTVSPFVFPAGEASKSGETYLALLNHMAQNQMTRTDLVAALGGGVVGDLAGFAAATYLRGIRFIQIPTTLLAAVDSSVGGKTAIDLPAGKNLAGAFCQPKLVVCDLDTLDSLPREIFQDGCAEVIKYGILYDSRLFAHLEQHGLDFDREAVITRCVELKRDVVEQDEFDTGLRMKLNLGHTIGHGVEACSGYTLSHGKAVAIGTAIIAGIAQDLGSCTQDTRQRILAVLRQFGLPTTTQYTAEALLSHVLSDKKRAADSIRLILPREIGHCDIVPTPVDALESLIKAGLSYGHHHHPGNTPGTDHPDSL